MDISSDDPFITPKPPSRGEKITVLDAPPLLALPNTSPSQLKRTLQAHLAETQKRLDGAAQLGNDLMKQSEEIEARLKELDESGENVSTELKGKLASLEKEYNEVGRETARALLTNKIMGGGSSPYGSSQNGPASPSTSLQSQGNSSPTKLNVPSRRQRNQPSRQHDLEFAAELGQGLLVEIRKLQGLLAEREKALKEVEEEKERLLEHAEQLEARIRLAESDSMKFRDQNWDLEGQVQELRKQEAEHREIETRFQAHISQLEAEKNAVIKELDDMKHNHGLLTEEAESKSKHYDIEVAALRRSLTTSESERAALKKKVEELNKELEESQKISLRLRQMENQRSDGEDRGRGAEVLPVPTDDTPEHSPAPSPMKHTPRHSMLESETLKSSLHHAHRMITNLKSNIHREKTEKAELKRLLQEARDELEQARTSFGDSPRTPGRKRNKTLTKSLRPNITSMLGGARKSRDEIIPIDTTPVDDEWEETHEDIDIGRVMRRAPGAYISDSIPTIDTSDAPGTPGDTSAFETAHEKDTDAFETANELDDDDTETEAYRTGVESPTRDNPTSADDLTETEDYSSRTLRAKSAAMKNRPMRLQRSRQRLSITSTASTEDESDGNNFRNFSFAQQNQDRDNTPEFGDIPMTPVAITNPRLKLRLNRARSRGSRITSGESSIFSNGPFGSVQSTPPSLEDSPMSGRPRHPSIGVIGKSLFAELGESPGMMSTDGEEAADQDASKLEPSPMVEMVDTGMMTDEIAPEVVFQEIIKEVPVEVPVEVIREVTKEVPVEVIKEVIKEVPVPVEIIKEVIKEVPVEFVKEVIREVPVEVIKEVIKEVPVDVVREIIKEVPVEVVKEVVREVPVEIIKEVIKEVPVDVVREVIIEVPVEVVKEVIKEVPVDVVREVIKEIPVEIIKEVVKDSPTEVVKEVIREVPVEVVKEVVREVPVEVIKEVIKEVPVEKIKEVVKEVPVEVVKEVIREVPVEVIKEIPTEVIKEVPVEVIKEVIREKEIPVEVIKEVIVEKEVPVEIIKEVIREKEVPVEVIKEVPVEVIKEIIREKEVPVEVIKEVIREVPIALPAMADMATQCDSEPEIRMADMGIQSEAPKLDIELPAIKLTPASISIRDGESQLDVGFEDQGVPFTSDNTRSTKTEAKNAGKLSLAFSAIRAQSTAPIEPEPSKATLVDASTSSDDDSTPKKVSETVEEVQQRSTTPSPNGESKGLFSSLFGYRTRRASETEAPAVTAKERTKTESDDDEDTIKLARLTKKRPSIPVPMADHAAQTDISQDFFDRSASGSTYSTVRAVPPSIKSRSSQESVGWSRSRASSDGSRHGAGMGTLRRPGSSSSTREARSNHPPLPADHKEHIAAAQQKINGDPALMPPPPLPASSMRTRPRTPIQPIQIVRPETPVTPSSRGGRTPRPRFSSNRSEVSSPASRRSSLSSFVSELDDRFQIHDNGFPKHDSTATDPRVIQAITQTMIGEYLWKYTRNASGKWSESRHKRFFWVHPYTRTLYWSDRDPTTAGRLELRAKSVAIEAVKAVEDENPMPPGLHQKSLVIITPGRHIKFTAPTSQRHETWFNALSYLLLRTGGDIEQETEIGPDELQEYSPPSFGNSLRGAAASLSSYRSSSRTSRTASPATTRNTSALSNRRPGETSRYSSISRLSNIFRPGSVLSGSIRSQPPDADMYNDHDGAMPSEEDLQARIDLEERALENVRACCDGKHDVGTLTRKQGNYHSHSYNSNSGRVRKSTSTNNSRRSHLHTNPPP